MFWNGVGSQKPILRWFKPTKWIRDLFADASIFHDVACLVGGAEEHEECGNEEFGVRCWRAVSHLSFLNRKWAMLWMNVDDDMLKNFGSYSFEYRDAPCYDYNKLYAEVALNGQ